MRDYSKFVKCVSEGYSISCAARKSGIHVGVIYNLLRDGRECEDSSFRSFYLAVENAKRVFLRRLYGVLRMVIRLCVLQGII